jgi:hypothetical protein
MDDIDRQFPYPRYLRMPFIFIPDGSPDGPDVAAFKAAHPGWVRLRATFIPRPQPEPEPAQWQVAGAEPTAWDQPKPENGARLDHRMTVDPASMHPANRHSETPEHHAAPPQVLSRPGVPPRVSHAERVPDAMQLRGMDLIMSGMKPDELEWLMRTRDRYRKRHEENSERNAGTLQAQTRNVTTSVTGSAGSLAHQLAHGAYRLLRDLDPVGTAQAAETLDKGQRESVAPPISGGASRADSTGKRTRLAQAVEGEMPVEPPVKPVEGEGANPGPGTLPEVVAPETASTPAPKPPSEVAPVPQPAAPVEAAPEQVRVRGDVKGGLPAPEARVSPDRRIHILDGDDYGGGGHRAGTGKPNKSEFPASWSDAKTISEIESVANDPASKRFVQPDGRIIVDGMRESVEIRVIIAPDRVTIVTGYPTNVPRNPKGKYYDRR